MPRILLTTCALLLCASVASALPPERVQELFDRGEFERARDGLLAARVDDPHNAFLLYNLACAHAQSGEVNDSVEALLDAFGVGFVDMFHMERDEHLEPIRAHAKYKALVPQWRAVLDARGTANRASLRATFINGYEFETDEQRRIDYASALVPGSFVDARAQIERVEAWAETFLPIAEADAERPDPWAMIVLPSQEDFVRFVGGGTVGGLYDRDRRRLITRDIGPSLRHEVFHLFHWRHMNRIGQVHPIWIQEGLASVVEDVEEGADGSLVPVASWRTNIAKRLGEMNRLTPWKRLFAMEQRDFTLRRGRRSYAEARAVMLFMHDQGKLPAWYASYTRGFDEDPMGIEAIEDVFDAPLDDVFRAYRAWLANLPEVGEMDRPGSASLGVPIEPGAGDGVEVGALRFGEQRPRSIDGERLRPRDVITEVQSQEIRTLDDLFRVLGEFEPGERVRVRVRRGTRDVEMTVELVQRRSGVVGY